MSLKGIEQVTRFTIKKLTCDGLVVYMISDNKKEEIFENQFELLSDAMIFMVSLEEKYDKFFTRRIETMCEV